MRETTALDRARYDAWVTREPEWAAGPDDRPEAEYPCDGRTQTVYQTWTEADAGLLDIIGWDRLGETHPITLPAPCGGEADHEPHVFTI